MVVLFRKLEVPLEASSSYGREEFPASWRNWKLPGYDSDLAELYEVSVKRLNEQVKRNIERFPEKFMFQLNEEEYQILKSQFATSSSHGGRRYIPFAFIE